MNLRSKFIILIGLVVVISYGITFYRTSQFQHELVLEQAARQARMLHKQVLMTRKWVAEHNGLFFLRQPGVEPNPWLAEAEVVDAAGRRYVKRNPAMVTRELSEYAAEEGFCRYRVTTLKAINPANDPDPWERSSLLKFEQGVPEVLDITREGDVHYLRYIAPLLVEESCLECHAHQGYKVGDIRGGLSVSIPIDWAFANIGKNNRMLLFIGVVTILLVGITIYLMIDGLVVRRLSFLARAMDQFPEKSPSPAELPAGNDEIGRLAGKFQDLCRRLAFSQEELDRTRQQVFQTEKLAALGRLAAGVAHEVNNPLGGMLNCVKSMREAPDDLGMHQRYLELIEKGLKRIGNIVQQLLNFGRREPLKYRQASIDELIRESFVLLGYALKKIELNLDLGLSRQYPVDTAALQQIIVNISLNAIQAMKDGGSFTVKTREEGGRVVLSFADTGQGISEEHLSQIFDPFFTTKDVGEGTGLGLSVTYALVQGLHGHISVTSKKGQGSCFRVELPVQVNNGTE
ncbi:ATP-binding protein [Thiovibrio sp. JS02]